MDAPIVRATLQAATLSGLSNFLAQCITCWRANPHLQANFTLFDFLIALRLNFNKVDLFHFFLFSLLVCPPNYLWQSWLEAQWPGYTQNLSSTEKETVMDKAVMGRSTGADTLGNGLYKRHDGAMTESSVPSQPMAAADKAGKKLNLRNTVAKFALDQTLGAAANTIIFIAGIALLRGRGLQSIQHDVGERFWPMIFAGQRLWPAVSVLQFTVVPFEYRTLVGSIVSLFWGIYLSLVSGGGSSGGK